MNTFALFGDKTSQSLSPQIYEVLSSHYKAELKYHCFNLDPLEYDFHLLEGFNVTNPFKKKTFNKISSIFQCTQIAKKTGYANCYDNIKKIADNTDVYGIEKTLESIDLDSFSIAIIGAGDVTSSIIETLQGKNYCIYNRTDKSKLYPDTNFHLLEQFKPDTYDFIINSTPIEIDHKNQFDLNYHRNLESPVNGLSMLIWQAMKNFSIWFGIDYVDEQNIKKEIYNEIKK